MSLIFGSGSSPEEGRGQELGRASLRVCVVVVGCPRHECISLSSLPGESHGQRSLVGNSPRSHRWVRHSLATKRQQQGVFIDPTEWSRYSLLGATVTLYLVITSQCLVIPCLFLGLLSHVAMMFFEDSCLFTAMSQCLSGCPVLGKTLSFQFGKSGPWSLECPNKLLYVAQWIGGIPASHRPAYDVMCDTTPACRKPLQFSVSQNVLLLEVLFSPFNVNWNLVVPLEIESQFLSRTCSCISPRVLETEICLTSLTSEWCSVSYWVHRGIVLITVSSYWALGVLVDLFTNFVP